MYRTGDLARFLADGAIEYLGRMDHQVKLHGFRIELGEIESVLLRHSDVARVAVIVREGGPGDKQLVAYVVPKPGMEAAVAGLRTHVERSLPAYMVPGRFVKLDALPLTDNGKLDRRALPAPDWSEVAMQKEATPTDQLETILVRIWQRVLRVPKISVDANFFELGGHSLLAVRLLSEVEKVVGRKIPLASIFRGSTVRSLAKLLRERAELNPEPLVVEYSTGNGQSLPIFTVAEPGVGTLGYALLARHLGEGQASYKLQAPGSRARAPLSLQDTKSLALQYITGMRAVQPQGPYSIVAMCGGCQIAEQMILQLEAQCEEVRLFAILDTWVLEFAHRRWGFHLLGLQFRLAWLRKASVREGVTWFRNAIRNRARAWTGKTTDLGAWHDAYWPQNFTQPRFKAPVVLFKRPKQPCYYVNDPTMGWGARSECGVQIYEMTAKHHEFLREPHAEFVGKIIMSRLKPYRTNAEDPIEACESTDTVTAATIS